MENEHFLGVRNWVSTSPGKRGRTDDEVLPLVSLPLRSPNQNKKEPMPFSERSFSLLSRDTGPSENLERKKVCRCHVTSNYKYWGSGPF